MVTRTPRVSAFAALGLAALLIAGLRVSSGAGEEPQTVKSARGGLLVKTPRYQYEVFFYRTGVRVVTQDGAGASVDASRLSGSATFYHPNSPKPWFVRPLHGVTTGPGEAPASLDLVIGLGAVPPAGAKVEFEIAGLPDPAESTAAFTVPIEFVKTPVESVATQPVPPPGTVTPGPRYVYGPGYYGFGYYQHPGPESAPARTNAPTVYSYRTPARRSSGGSSGSVHDWTTGRDLPAGGLISKPWLRPMD